MEYEVYFCVPTYPDDSTEVLAAFPRSIAEGDASPGKVLCFAHDDMHNEVDIEFVLEAREATREEYENLLAEIKSIYNDTEIVVVDLDYFEGVVS